MRPLIPNKDTSRLSDSLVMSSIQNHWLMVTRIERVVSRLAEHPHSGRHGRVAGTREVIVPGLPYLVVYRVEERQVTILRVFHGKREPLSS